ncbi:MAG: TolC family protein [Rhodospirillales bacterium]
MTLPVILISAVLVWSAFPGTAFAQAGIFQTAPPELPRQASPPTPQPAQTGAPGGSPYAGSVPLGMPTPGVIELSLSEAIDRGLRRNLGLVLKLESTRLAEAERRFARAGLLPSFTIQAAEALQEINLQALGFTGQVPGLRTIVGPFSVSDLRGYVTQPVLDFTALYQNRAASAGLRAARLSYQDARDIVVLTVVGLYLQAVAGEARAAAAESQYETAQALYKRAEGLKAAGMVAGIDVLRAQVQMQAQQQRVIFYRNEFAKRKLELARAIGLASGQEFRLAEKLPETPPPVMSLEQALAQAYSRRADYQSALAAVNSAELSSKAARAQRYPAITIDADYGALGRRPTESHGTFAISGTLAIPVFDGGRFSAAVLETDALLAQRRAEAEDLRAAIYYQVQAAFLDLAAAGDQVAVAKSSIQLAARQLAHAENRYSAGVTTNIEVVQAQEAVATANENYIASLHQYNFAKASLVRALGGAEGLTKQFLGAR